MNEAAGTPVVTTKPRHMSMIAMLLILVVALAGGLVAMISVY